MADAQLMVVRGGHLPTGHLKETFRQLAATTSRCLRVLKFKQIVGAIVLTAVIAQSTWTLLVPTVVKAATQSVKVTVNVTLADGTTAVPVQSVAQSSATAGVTDVVFGTNEFSFTGDPTVSYTFNLLVGFDPSSTVGSSLPQRYVSMNITGTTPGTVTSGANGDTLKYTFSAAPGKVAAASAGAPPTASNNLCTTNNNAGNLWGWSPNAQIAKSICDVGQYIIDAGLGLMHWLVNTCLGWTLSFATVSPYLNFNNPPGTAIQVTWAKALYTTSLNLVNYVIVLVLIFLSFVNILHINIDTYGLKKIMPSFVLGVILANFGLLIVHFMTDAAEVLAFSFVGQDVGTFIYKFFTTFAGGFFTAPGGLTIIMSLLVGAVLTFPVGIIIIMGFVALLFVPAGLLFVLGLLFWLRFYVIVMLAAVSPVAFVMIGIPLTESYFKQWWSLVVKWILMSPVALFFLWVAMQINVEKPTLSSLLIGCVLMYLAIKVPFSLGGSLSAQFGGVLKKVGSWGAKTGDKTFGDVTKKLTGTRVSPASFYHGWKQRSDEKWAEHLNQGGVQGRAYNEATGRAVAGVVTGQWRGLPKNVGAGYKEEMLRGQDIVRSEKKKRLDAIVNRNNGTDEDLRKDFEAAIDVGDIEASEASLSQLMSRGLGKQADLDQFQETFGKGNQALDAAMSESIMLGYARSAGLSHDVLVPTMTVVNNKVRFNNDPGENMKAITSETARKINSLPAAQARSQVKVWWRENFLDANGNEITPDRWSSKQKAMFKGFAQLSQTALDDVPQLQALVAEPEIQLKFSEANYQGIGNKDARDATKKLVDTHGFGDLVPKDGRDVNKTHYMHAQALADENHWREVQDAFQKKFDELQSKMDATGNSSIDLKSGTISASDRTMISGAGKALEQGLVGQHDDLRRALKVANDTRDKFIAQSLPGQAKMFEKIKREQPNSGSGPTI